MVEHLVYSFVIDEHPKFSYQAWHLARSLIKHCGAKPADINVQVTPYVHPEIRRIFFREGYNVRDIQGLGDGQFCNKIAQLPNLLDLACDRIILLDTDMIAVGDIRPLLHGNRVQAKVVDLSNPSLDALKEIFTASGGVNPEVMMVDATDEQTIVGNANGGFYAVPQELASQFSREWRRWMEWLLRNDEVLRREGKLNHIDQISAALAFQRSKVPYAPAPSNVNYYIHFHGQHRYFDENEPICLLHYHSVTMNLLGQIEPQVKLTGLEASAVAAANQQIREGFQSALFQNFRYGTRVR